MQFIQSYHSHLRIFISFVTSWAVRAVMLLFSLVGTSDSTLVICCGFDLSAEVSPTIGIAADSTVRAVLALTFLNRK